MIAKFHCVISVQYAVPQLFSRYMTPFGCDSVTESNSRRPSSWTQPSGWPSSVQTTSGWYGRQCNPAGRTTFRHSEGRNQTGGTPVTRDNSFPKDENHPLTFSLHVLFLYMSVCDLWHINYLQHSAPLDAAPYNQHLHQLPWQQESLSGLTPNYTALITQNKESIK